MQYAHDVHGNWVGANKTKYRKHSQFFCGCPERHQLKLVKPSGNPGKRKFTDYFAHVSKKFKSSHGNACISMRGRGESMDHFNAKHMLREMVGKYTFTKFRCTSCLHTHDMNTDGCEVHIEITSTDGRWRYDCLLTRGHTDIAALEVVHSHKVTPEKAAAVRASGLEIAEFRAQDVLQNLGRERVHLENLLVILGKCQRCLVNAWFIWRKECLAEELQELIRQDAVIAIHYSNMHEHTIRIRVQQAAAVALYKREFTAWLLQCFLDELQEIVEQENAMAKYYNDIHEHARILKIESDVHRCKSLLMFNFRPDLRNGIHLQVPNIGNVICHKAHAWTHGLMLTNFTCNMHLATDKFCIVLFSDGDEIMRKYPHPNVHRQFHIFLHCSTVLRCLGQYPVDHSTVFVDCRWPMLKRLEQSQSICVSCGKYSHRSEHCSYKFCVRCGRSGHLLQRCNV